LSDSARSAAVNLAGPALDLAQGASAFQAASNALKGAALDKLLGPTAVFAGSLVGILRTMKAVVDQSGILERGIRRIAGLQQIQGKFETLLKSAEAAQKRMEELYKFTSRTPFDFQDIAEGNRLLQALSKGALAGAGGMKLVGDVAAATGQSFAETSERIGKLYAALRSGRALDKVIFQLQMSGIVTDELAAKLELAESAGTSFTQKWEMVTEVLRRSEGGMQNEMKSLDALRKRLDNVSKMMEVAFGKPFIEAEAKAIENTIKATENMTPVLQKIAQDSAPVLQFFRNVRNSIVDATIATKGFADTVSVAFEVFKAGAIAITAGALVNSVAALSRGLGRGRQVREIRGAQLDRGAEAPAFRAGMDKSQQLAADAASSFAEGALLTAAALKAESLWTALTTRALMVHGVALRAAKASGDAFRIGTYLQVAALGAFRGAAAALGPILTMLKGAFLAAFGNPVIVAGTALAALGVAATKYMESLAEANKAQIDFILSLSKIRDEARKAVTELKTLDDYREQVTKNQEEQRKTQEKIDALGKRPDAVRETSLDGTFRIRFGGTKNQQEIDDYDAKLQELQRTMGTLKTTRADMDRRLPSLGMGVEEQGRLAERVQQERALGEAMEQSKIDRASTIDRRFFLQQRMNRLRGEAARGRDIEDGLLRPALRQSSPTELMQLAKQISDEQKAGRPVSDELLQRQQELIYLSKNWRQLQQQAEQDRNELFGVRDQVVEGITKTETDRVKNDALLRGDARGARAAEDAAALMQLRDEYRRLGLSRDQADQDFNTRIRAEAQQAQKITADSMQAIGGGGGFAATNPMMVAQQRIAAANEAQTKLLEVIANNTRSPGIQ
jgi:hypothetical protein